MRVTLGRAQARVAEQLLNGAEVGAALQQVRREGMTQRMGLMPLRALDAAT